MAPKQLQNSIPAPSLDLEGYLQHLQSLLQPATALAASLPGPSDLSLHRTLDPGFSHDLDETSASLVSLIDRLVATVSNSKQYTKGDVTAASLEGTHRLDDNLSDAVDRLLERADRALDEHSGAVPMQRRKVNKSQEAAAGSSSSSSANPNSAAYPPGALPAALLNAPISPLPQKKWKAVDNSRQVPWQHALSEKPHAITPLQPASVLAPDAVAPPPRAGMYCCEGAPEQNPYFAEIKAFTPPASALAIPTKPEPPAPLVVDEPRGGGTPFAWVSTLAELELLRAHLNEDRVVEIAIDVEHHSYRTYQGLVCLVQLSTRWGDWIIDTLSPVVRANFYKLNEAFANPAKVKVLHGAEHDILWLQRDLNAYIVGLFDTYHASHSLLLPQHSLAYLLLRYTGFEADKRWQLADWRIRPLPAPMLYYARADTHSLLYVYDALRVELSKLGGAKTPEQAITDVFERSKQTAARTYAKEQWDETGEGREGWRTMWKKVGGEEAKGIDERFALGIEHLGRTERIYRALHDWRDKVARDEDESPRYVLSSANLLNLASRAPTNASEVSSSIGPAFKRRAMELSKVIAKAVAAWNAAADVREQRAKAAYAANLSGSAVAEETGEKISRDQVRPAAAAVSAGITTPKAPVVVTSLWEALTPNASTTSLVAPSVNAPAPTAARALTSSLFGRKKPAPAPVPAPVPASSAAQPTHLLARSSSLFGGSSVRAIAPLPRSASTTAGGTTRRTAVEQIKRIKTGLGEALSGLLGKRGADGAPVVQSKANAVPSFPSAPTVPVAVATVVTSTAPQPAQARQPSPPPPAEDDGIVQVGKKRKKDKWTKEEKRAKKLKEAAPTSDAQPPASASASGTSTPAASFEPFDYTGQVSVLDASAAPSGGKKDRKRKKGGKEANGGGGAKGKGEKRSLAVVATSRNRSEIKGGKSMSFAK